MKTRPLIKIGIDIMIIAGLFVGSTMVVSVDRSWYGTKSYKGKFINADNANANRDYPWDGNKLLDIDFEHPWQDQNINLLFLTIFFNLNPS